MKTRRTRLISLILFALLVGLLAVVGQPAGQAHAAIVCPSSGSLQGVDVTHNTGPVDWTQVANAGISFGYAQAEDGTTSDSAFQANFAAMKSAGVKRGATLFFEPAQDPTAQANAFLASLAQASFSTGDLIPAIDIEVAGGQTPATILSELQTAAQTIQTAIGVGPVIYTSPAFWNGSLGGSTAFAGNPLWIAALSVSCPNIPSAWNTWALWQYSDTGNVPGIGFSVDLDQTNGASLPTYALQDTTPPVLSLPAPITTNATSLQGAVVSYTVTASDPDNPASQLTISCAPASGSTFAIGATTVNCTASDPAGNTASGSFQVVVNGAPTQISQAISLVNSFGLKSRIRKTLDAELQLALAAVNAGRVNVACIALDLFVGEVKLLTGHGITSSQAGQLLAAATQIKAVLGC